MNFKNIKYAAYIIFFLGLYLGGRFAINSIGIFVLISIIGLIKDGARSIKEFPKLLILPIAFYLIHIIGSFYSSNSSDALFDLEVKFSFLALPIIFGLQKDDSNIDLTKILKLFVYVSLIMSAVYLSFNIRAYIESGRLLYYMEFSKSLHPSYLSLYLVFNILVGIYLIVNKNINLPIVITSLLLSFMAIYYAESKAGQIATFAILVFLLFKSIKLKYRKLAIIGGLILIIGFGYIIKDNSRFRSIIYSLSHLKEIIDHPEAAVESTAMRLLSWDASLEVIKSSPIIGVGTGDVKDELSKLYLRNNFIEAYNIKMNAHNQFLETTIGLGIIGFIVLVSMLIFPLFSIKKESLLLQGFILIVSINILVESMFNTQAGVLFIVFVYTLLVFQLSRNAEKPYNT